MIDIGSIRSNKVNVLIGPNGSGKSRLLRKLCTSFLSRGDKVSPWHRITIDVEHVLPKQQFPSFTFDPRNLNISCKRCNMEIKGTDIRFYLGKANETDPFRSDLYSFAHPNSDVPNDHLQILSLQVNDKLLIWYLKRTPKGHFAYDYFELNEIEINSFTAAQGVLVETPSENLPPQIAQQLRAILKLEGGE